MKTLFVSVALTSIISLVGCSGSDGSAEQSANSVGLDNGTQSVTCDAGTRVCEPGRQVSCACPDGTTASSQTCASDGMSWGACSCASTTANELKCHRVGLAVASSYEVQIGANPACGQVTTVGSVASRTEQPLQYLHLGCSSNSSELTALRCSPATVAAYAGLGAYCCEN